MTFIFALYKYTYLLTYLLITYLLTYLLNTKIYHIVYSDEDVSALQSDLHVCNLVEWSKEWQMF